MKLDDKEFKELKALLTAKKQGKLDEAKSARLEELLSKKKGANDPRWWDNYPELTKDVINIPFNWIPGKDVNLVLPAGSTVNATQNFPGVAVVEYLPTIGRSVKSSDGFNAQMRQLWLDMHRKYRGIGQYQASDLGIAMLCVTSIFTLMAQLQRVYGVLNTYKVMNRTVPLALYEALHIDMDLSKDMANLRYFLNSRIERMRQLCLPKGIAAIEAEIVNNTFVYKDSENPRASLFLFDSQIIYRYNAIVLSTGGCAQGMKILSFANGSTPMGSDGLKLSDIITMVDTTLDLLLTDDDITKMCSDLIAAYGPENVVTLGYVPENYRIEPVYDYEKLVQFHNTKFVGESVGFVANTSVVDAATATSLRGSSILALVYQENDVIYQEFSTGTTYKENSANGKTYLCSSNSLTTSQNRPNPVADKVIIDTWVENPDKVELLCGTRFTVGAEREESLTDGGNAYFYQYITAFGLALPTVIRMYGVDSAGNVFGSYLGGSQYKLAAITNATNIAIADLLRFDWHPLIDIIDISGGTVRTIGDVDNFTVVTIENVERIHDVAIYSAFKIPNVTYIN